jgi:non-lysosomal glucosylceramidase
MDSRLDAVSDGAAMKLVFAYLCAATVSVIAGPFDEALARHEKAERAGFHWTSANDFPQAYTSKGGATDEGSYGLPLFGGIGTGAFGRDLHGHFDRWQWQPGFPRKHSLDSASMGLRWSQGDKVGAYRLGEAGWDKPLPKGVRDVAVLWPVVSERMVSAEWPVEILVESWSPVLPHDYEAAAMPVVFFDVIARNTSKAPVTLDVALFMPNFLGWRKGIGNTGTTVAEQKLKRDPAGLKGSRDWPERSHTGNFAQLTEADASHGFHGGVTMGRTGYLTPTRDMEGQILLGIGGGPEVKSQQMVTSLVNGNPASAHASLANYYLDAATAEFFKSGSLPADHKPWVSTATEMTASAVAGGLTLAPGAQGSFTLVMVWDMPLVEFGSGRTWEKAYTTTYGGDGKQARRIARDALAKRAEWRAKLDQWHTTTLGKGDAAAKKRCGATINDLYFVVSGGTAWVAKERAKPGLEPALLGSGEHFSILEGFDTGYYFTSTFDLWPHAQPALEANWPHLAGLLLEDFLRIAPMTCAEPRLILNTGVVDMRKTPNKIPHDVGCPSGDPWHLVNEYNTARNSNDWKDHNPEFILSLYVHRKNQPNAPKLTDEEWKTLLGLAESMAKQDKQNEGLPYHDTQGDNTWDALHFTGPSPYSGALTLGAWAALAEFAKQQSDAASTAKFEAKLKLAQASFDKHFWNGRYYRSATNGEQAEWSLCDALLGILMADSAGLKDLLPEEKVKAHLIQVAERNWKAFGSGQIGPSLLAPADGPIPTGGLQIGEVIVGSARSSIALMRRYGLQQQADAITDAINRTLYEVSSLQFRTPAAWNSLGNFRAPNNMRPLASWHSLWPVKGE